MYEHSELVKGLTSGVVAGTGIVVLPNTGDNLIGIVLSSTAIGIGILAIGSQGIVRLMRYRAARQKG